MYFYIFEHSFDYTSNLPAVDQILFLPKAPLLGDMMTTHASVVFSYNTKGTQFKLMKNRFGYSIDILALKYLGIRLFDDGFFVSDKELLLFTLKYQGLTEEKALNFPLI